jgi:hypothetical protein
MTCTAGVETVSASDELARAANAASTVVRTVSCSKGLASVLCTPSERAISRTSRS